MRSKTWRAVAAGLVWMAAGVRGEQPAAATAPELSLAGEVVDMHCYLTRGARGPEHAGCANACLSRGVTPGFRAEDGRLFVLLSEKPFPVKDVVAGMAGKRVTVKGALVERDGVKGLQVKSVEPAPAP
ncbi:MAG TPA: hypothetical protein VF310_11935 [Vicinamibacteria bacterium]